MGLSTPLHKIHLDSGATIVDFGGWDMPLHYGSQIAEHRAVRQDAGMFDVSHMCIIDVHGRRAREFLRTLLANDVGKLGQPGKALYSCMLLPTGGVIDDLIVYFMTDTWFRIVVNAGTRDKDFAWIIGHAAGYDLNISARTDLAMIAVQGPNARDKAASLLAPAQRTAALAIAPFAGMPMDSWFVARTGYTGEDGFEIMLPAGDAAKTWAALVAAGVAPAGLGARDTLRLEAGMNLYGNDMDETRHPLESGLEWTVAFEPADRQFIGRTALEQARAAGSDHLVGLVLEERGVLRSHQIVITDDLPASANTRTGSEQLGNSPSGGEHVGAGQGNSSPSDEHAGVEQVRRASGGEDLGRVTSRSTYEGGAQVGSASSSGGGAGGRGEVTSGTFSPTMNRSIALARVPRDAGPRVRVDIRGKLHAARIVKPPFVRHGKVLVQI
jgi:aminomethyltransferase